MRSPNERDVPAAPPARADLSRDSGTLEGFPIPPAVAAHAEQSAPATHSPAGDFSVILRLGAHGEIIKNSGGSEQLAETVAYVRRLTELAGELLGLEGFTAFECTFTQGRCLAFVESNGDTVCCGHGRRRTFKRYARGWGCERRRRGRAGRVGAGQPGHAQGRRRDHGQLRLHARRPAGVAGDLRRCSTTARSPRRGAACCGCAKRSPPAVTRWRSA